MGLDLRKKRRLYLGLKMNEMEEIDHDMSGDEGRKESYD